LTLTETMRSNTGEATPIKPEYLDSLYARIASGHIAHGLLLLGPRGSGKRAAAGCLSGALVCDRNDGKPCGICHGCRLYQSGNHPEVIAIEPENGMIRIGRIRQMQQQICIKPVQGRRWVVLIHDADRMNPQAQNALLKTLEEPPQAILILTAGTLTRLLPTIRSRCQIFRIPSLSQEGLARLVADRTGIDDREALLYARMGGSPGQALALAETPAYAELRRSVLTLISQAAMGGMETVLKAEAVLAPLKDQMDKVLDILLSWTRDLRVYYGTQRLDWIINQEYADTIQKACSRLSEQTIYRQERYLRKTLRMIEENAHPVLSVQQFLLAVAKGELDADHRRDKV